MEIAYHPSLIIKNLDALPHGSGCKYLLAIRGQGEDLIAKAWKRTRCKARPGEVLVVFATR